MADFAFIYPYGTRKAFEGSPEAFCVSTCVVIRPIRCIRMLQSGERVASRFRKSYAGLQLEKKYKKGVKEVIYRGRHASCRNGELFMKGDDDTNPWIRGVAGLLAIVLAVTSIQPIIKTLFGSESGQSILDIQLKNVPVFAVTDETGRPFLEETEDHSRRSGYFFLRPTDAQQYLESIKSPEMNAQVRAVSLTEAEKYILQKPAKKQVPEDFTLFPDEHEARLARDITDGQFTKVFGAKAVPLFYVDRLAIEGDNDEGAFYPLFFEKEKLDKYLEGLNSRGTKSGISEADVQVIELQQTIREIRAGTNPRLQRVVFMPLDESLKFVRESAS